jgi:hypothetical protein
LLLTNVPAKEYLMTCCAYIHSIVDAVCDVVEMKNCEKKKK